MKTVNRHHQETGAVVLIVAMSLMLLAGIAAIALDGGMAYNERRSTQNAADNAALAGAWALCHGGNAEEGAMEFAVANGYVDGVTVQNPHDGAANLVFVSITSEVETTFGETQGMSQIGVQSTAIAQCVPGGASGSGTVHAALFSGGTSCDPTRLWNNTTTTGLVYSASDLEIQNNAVVNGPVHGNRDVSVGNNARINGPLHANRNLTVGNNAVHNFGSSATYVGSVALGSNTPTWNPVQVPTRDPLEFPEAYDAADYAPGGTRALAAGGQYHNHPGGWNVANNANPSSGLHYVSGNVTFGNNVSASDFTIVATGTITFGNNNNFDPYVDNLVAMSTAGGGNCDALVIDTGNNAFAGVLFAPNGRIHVGNNGNFPGAVIGLRVTLRNNASVSGAEVPWSATPPEVLLLG